MATPLQSARPASSPLGVALAFVGMFVVGSLGVQLLSSLPGGSQPAASEGAPAVVAHPSTLWSDLGAR